MGTLKLEPIELTRTWYASAHVLLIENKTCDCCRSMYSTPIGTFIKLETIARSSTSRLLLRKQVPRYLDLVDLPCIMKYIETSIDRCGHCFSTTLYDEDQLTLFPRKLVVRRSWDNILEQHRDNEETDKAAKKSIEPYSLDEF